MTDKKVDYVDIVDPYEDDEQPTMLAMVLLYVLGAIIARVETIISKVSHHGQR